MWQASLRLNAFFLVACQKPVPACCRHIVQAKSMWQGRYEHDRLTDDYQTDTAIHDLAFHQKRADDG